MYCVKYLGSYIFLVLIPTKEFGNGRVVIVIIIIIIIIIIIVIIIIIYKIKLN